MKRPINLATRQLVECSTMRNAQQPELQSIDLSKIRENYEIKMQQQQPNDLNSRFITSDDNSIPPMRQALTKLKSFFSWNRNSPSWDSDNEFSECKVRVKTLDLFRYAQFREKLAFGFGVVFMWYAASWQPISVFILAIMASLMGQYSKQITLISQLNQSLEEFGDMNQTLPPPPSIPAGSPPSLDNELNSTGFGPELVFASAFRVGSSISTGNGSRMSTSDYNGYGFLGPLHAIVTPFFDCLTGGSSVSTSDILAPNEDIKENVHDLIDQESKQFLRKSFEINASAFILALTQLTAFFIGVTLITWAAKKQASRIKVLYFKSCLHQEMLWFQAIDSDSGSGSSLNALVDRFEDGIGMKLALLCYFLGHVALFAMTAFSQMFKLAAFCMHFVILVGLIIIYLCDWQAVAIGEYTLFARRSLQLAEEIIGAIRTVFAFNGQQKEITRFSVSLEPVYRKSLIKHLYTALNTSLSKFSIFACFSAYCFYATHLFPPHNKEPLDKATVLAVMRGAEVSIVNILISIPFMEALQQAKGSIARIYAAIERRSKIDPSSDKGIRPSKWEPSISFRMVQFGYTDRSGLTRRRSTLAATPYKLPGSGRSSYQAAKGTADPCAGNVVDQRSSSANVFNESADHTAQKTGSRGSRQWRRQSSIVKGKDWRRPSAIKRMLNTVVGQGIRNGNRRVLSLFNLDIKAGQSVALVGPSGSGKSTVLSLVQRLYDINGGHLFIGQHDIKDLSVAWLRNQIGVVAQEPRLFDMTIEENILLGLPDDDDINSYVNNMDGNHKTLNHSKADLIREREEQIRQQVLEAAQAAGVHEFVSRLPKGYQTRVGPGGVQLSGGQKQRIAIARALIRKPKILLLDESTSALDTESEAHVQTALKQASVGCTTLTVAHRLTTIKYADLIVVMKKGQVVEYGSHDELVADDGSHLGIYKQMYEEQLEAVNRAKQKTEDGEPALEQPRANGPKTPTSGKKGSLSQVKFTMPTTEFSKRKDANDNVESTEIGSAPELTQNLNGNSKSQRSKPLSNLTEMNPDDSKVSIIRPTARDLWKFLDLPKWSSMGSVIVCLIAGLILPMNLIAHSYLFSAFAYEEPEQLGHYLRVFGLLVLSFSTLVFVVSFLQVFLPGYVGEKISTRLRVRTMDSILRKPVFYFDIDTNSPGYLCDRFNTCISNIQSLAGTRVATMLEAISTLSVGAMYGFGQNLSLSLFCLTFALLVLVTTIIESRIVQEESSLQQKFDAQLAHLMVDALSNIKTIASLNKEKFFINKFSELINRREVGIGGHIVCLRIFLMSLKFVMPAMSWSASMYYGCHLLVDGRIDLQTVFIVCPVVLFAVNDTFRALVFLPELLKARKSIESLYLMHREFSPEVLRKQTLSQQLERQRRYSVHPGNAGAKPDVAASLCKRTRPGLLKSISFMKPGQLPDYMDPHLGISRLNSFVPGTKARGCIQFKDVHFAYPQRPGAHVLQGLTLNVSPGETLALVGSSGSGKSTCAAILEKFYDFQEGTVSVDGHDLRLLNEHWIRSQLGLVTQEPTLLSYTIGDNIRYGDNARFVPMEEIVRAACQANIHEFIMSLPGQYDTQVSSHSGSGCQLSGGQRQRIAIARALISNAPILIFDEATSALDSRNERLVQDALDKARTGRTSIIIAHRLASIREADKIAVLREGCLVEMGKHEDLLKLESGHYRSLWLRQEGANEQHRDIEEEDEGEDDDDDDDETTSEDDDVIDLEPAGCETQQASCTESSRHLDDI